jgi:hypothetical protein
MAMSVIWWRIEILRHITGGKRGRWIARETHHGRDSIRGIRRGFKWPSDPFTRKHRLGESQNAGNRIGITFHPPLRQASLSVPTSAGARGNGVPSSAALSSLSRTHLGAGRPLCVDVTSSTSSSRSNGVVGKSIRRVAGRQSAYCLLSAVRNWHKCALFAEQDHSAISPVHTPDGPLHEASDLPLSGVTSLRIVSLFSLSCRSAHILIRQESSTSARQITPKVG